MTEKAIFGLVRSNLFIFVNFALVSIVSTVQTPYPVLSLAIGYSSNPGEFFHRANSMYYGNSATPTGTLGAGVGTGATYSIVGTDSTGLISITSVPAGVSIIATITMSTAATSHPNPVISFQGSSTTQSSFPTTITAAWQSSSTWAFLCFGNSAPVADSSTWSQNYWVGNI